MAQADSKHITVPLYALVGCWKLRRIFWQASLDLGDEFAVPVRPQGGLTGGAVVVPSSGEAVR
jgi:hypothetical protein